MMQLAEHILPAEGVDLGPARVLADAAGRDVSLALESGASVTAQLALALPYRAVEGDVVLVLSKGARHYVVGVLEGSGLTQLTFRGDVAVRAVGGSLELAADEGVTVRGPKLALLAGDLEITAKAMTQQLLSFAQRVRGVLSTRAEQITSVAEKSHYSQAKSTTIVSEEAVRVNGEQIHLG